MKVHWVCRLIKGVQDDSNGFVLAEVVYIPLRIGVREVTFTCKKKYRLVIISSLGLIVHDPYMMACFVRKQINFNSFRRIWV